MRALRIITLTLSVFVLASCYDDSAIKTRLDNLENGQQIAAIKASISSLELVSQEVKNTIRNLESSNTQILGSIEELRVLSQSLDSKISELKAYFNEELSKKEEWIASTFCTIEKYNAIVDDLDRIKRIVNGNYSELSNKIDTSISSIRSWVNELLNNYYTSTEVDGKINELKSKLSSFESKLNSFLMNSIRSVVFVPEYADGKYVVEDITKPFDVVYEIRPKECAEPLVNAYSRGDAILFYETREVSTRVDKESCLTINSVSLKEAGFIQVTATMDKSKYGKSIASSLIIEEGSGSSIQSNYSIFKSIPFVYKDNGNEYGYGVYIDGTIWAPVNCGTDANHPRGLLYQWGRKYGQGYDGELPAVTFAEGPVSLSEGNSESNSNTFYTVEFTSESEYYPYDWCTPGDDALWNGGTLTNPIKTEYDPCPQGWRVPTLAELNLLSFNYSGIMEFRGEKGRWYSGNTTFVEGMSNAVFLSYGPSRGANGGMSNEEVFYWSSTPQNGNADLLYDADQLAATLRVFGERVRCVKE